MSRRFDKHVYVHLFHGRRSPDEQLEDWGLDGPLLGPFSWAHMTYATDIKLGEPNRGGDSVITLHYVGELVYYGEIYYGDVSIMAQPSEEEMAKLAPHDEWRAQTLGVATSMGDLWIAKSLLHYGHPEADAMVRAIVLTGPVSALNASWAVRVHEITGRRIRLVDVGFGTWEVRTPAGSFLYHDGIRIRDDGKGWLDA